MLVILILAVNLAVLRAVYGLKLGFSILMVLPTINFLLFGLLRIGRGRADRPFWVGFDVAGSLMVVLLFLLDWGYYRFDWDFFIFPLVWLRLNNWTSEVGPGEPAITYGFCFLIYTVPQLLAALIAGGLSARYRIVRRHPPPVERREAGEAGQSNQVEGGPRSRELGREAVAR
jgi:hypothetical protein